MRRLVGVAALITGASSGIGRGLAGVFVREGARVFLTARGEDRLRETAEDIAEVFVRLASPESAGVTGQALNARDYHQGCATPRAGGRRGSR